MHPVRGCTWLKRFDADGIERWQIVRLLLADLHELEKKVAIVSAEG
jgi:hypothetical protein